MELHIDGYPVTPEVDESLLSMVKRLGLDTGELATRPIAAQMAGETFTLNYVPVRAGDAQLPPSLAMRRAIHASGGEVKLLRSTDPLGKKVYERTLLFVCLLAARRLFPEAKVRVDYAVGAALSLVITKTPALSTEDVALLHAECRRIVEADYPLQRKRLDIEEAISFFARDGQCDKVRLLEWRSFTYFDVYRHEDYMDYFYGEMAPGTGYASVFDLQFNPPCVFLLRPDETDPARPSPQVHLPKFEAVFRESDAWARLLHVSVVADLNDMVRDGKIRELIRVNEALHEKKFSDIADEIVSRGARAVLIAGPSSSGKTTSANRLCTQLRVLGKSPVLVSLDDYYIDRDLVKPGPDGTIDLEHINTIDTALFRKDLASLLAGETVQLPRFDFMTGRRVMDGRKLRLDADTPLVVEGLHGLNPALLPEGVEPSRIFRLYVSALTTLNLDDHNRIPTADVRLLRRLVRDYETRGASVERTLSMWESVRHGEERWIFPYQENADVIMNTSLIYELVVLKKHIFPLLAAVPPENPCYSDAVSIVKFLNYFLGADVDDEIPPTSILREFVGGNAFYR